MIEIDIPSIDPIQHEPRVFLGMSARQIICIVPGVALGTVFFMLGSKQSMDLGIVLAAIPVSLAVAMGWYKRFNMKFEDYVRLWYFNNFVSCPKRIYKTDREEDPRVSSIKERQIQEREEQEAKLAKKKAEQSGKSKNNNQ